MTTTEAFSVDTARALAETWLADFAAALAAGDRLAAAELFLPDAYWRDILALTWDLRTFHGKDRIADELVGSRAGDTVGQLRLEDRDPDMFERARWGRSVEAFFALETDIARGRGHLRLLQDPDSGRWRAWTLLTTMEELKGFEERTGHRRRKGPSAHLDPPPGAGQQPQVTDPQVVVIGAAQGGLAVAARLRQLDVDTLVVERHARVGDNWRKRYQSLVLHNEVWANHLPYLPFPSTFPVYISKEQLADWLEVYAIAMELDVWTSTTIRDVRYDDASRRWTMTLQRGDGSDTVLQPAHIVLATGVFGGERRLQLRGAEQFRGTLLHATEYDGNIPADGVKALVIGSGSSAHDVAQDLFNRGAEVTMLQRSSTCVVSVEPGAARAYAIYQEDGIPVDDADLISNSFPLPLLAELHKDFTKRVAELDRDLLAGLEAAGFKLDFGDDGSGFLMKYHRSGGGYYINVGCSELIVEGKIKVKQGVEVRHLTETGAVFSDGTSIDVDLVVVAIGYQNMSETVRAIIGDEVADRVGPVWGLDDEGEVRNMWRRTAQPGLWIMGGSLQQCRPYSRYLALQIKADEEGLTPYASSAVLCS